MKTSVNGRDAKISSGKARIFQLHTIHKLILRGSEMKNLCHTHTHTHFNVPIHLNENVGTFSMIFSISAAAAEFEVKMWEF